MRFDSKKNRFKKRGIPSGLRFLTRTMQLKPKVIKAVIQPWCPDIQATLEADILQLVDSIQPIDSNRPETVPNVSAVTLDEQDTDIVDWLNRVYRGELLGNNDLIEHHEQIDDRNMLTNHELWQRVSRILLAEIKWTIKQPDTYNPNITDLIFRNKKHFYGGIWNYFSEFWAEGGESRGTVQGGIWRVVRKGSKWDLKFCHFNIVSDFGPQNVVYHPISVI